jgi:uncharacterized protein YnzC (UPF0291/DUF896 family)
MQKLDSTTATDIQDSISSNVPERYTEFNRHNSKKDPTKALGSMPQEIYSKKEYCSDSMLYLIVPQHKVAIPYGNSITPKLLETLADTLVKHGDVQSSQTITDYPIVTHVQLDMHYSDYEQIEQLKIIPVYKPRKALSGWEELRKQKTRKSYLNTVKVMQEKEASRVDPFEGGQDLTPQQPASYAISPDRKAEIAREGR